MLKIIDKVKGAIVTCKKMKIKCTTWKYATFFDIFNMTAKKIVK